MDEYQNPEEATKGGQDHLRAAADDLKEAADAKVETIHQAVEQKAYELRGFEGRGKARLKSSEALQRLPGPTPDPRRRAGTRKARPTFAAIQPRLS